MECCGYEDVTKHHIQILHNKCYKQWLKSC